MIQIVIKKTKKKKHGELLVLIIQVEDETCRELVLVKLDTDALVDTSPTEVLVALS